MFAIASDRLDSARAGEIATAKSCAEARTANARGASSLGFVATQRMALTGPKNSRWRRRARMPAPRRL